MDVALFFAMKLKLILNGGNLMRKTLFVLCMMATLIMYQSIGATTLDNHWLSGGIGQIQPHDGVNGGWLGFGQTFTLQAGDDNKIDDITVWLNPVFVKQVVA